MSWISQLFAGQPLAEKANRIHFGSAPRVEIFGTRKPTRLKGLLGGFCVLYFQDLRLNKVQKKDKFTKASLGIPHSLFAKALIGAQIRTRPLSPTRLRYMIYSSLHYSTLYNLEY